MSGRSPSASSRPAPAGWLIGEARLVDIGLGIEGGWKGTLLGVLGDVLRVTKDRGAKMEIEFDSLNEEVMSRLGGLRQRQAIVVSMPNDGEMLEELVVAMGPDPLTRIKRMALEVSASAFYSKLAPFGAMPDFDSIATYLMRNFARPSSAYGNPYGPALYNAFYSESLEIQDFKTTLPRIRVPAGALVVEAGTLLPQGVIAGKTVKVSEISVLRVDPISLDEITDEQQRTSAKRWMETARQPAKYEVAGVGTPGLQVPVERQAPAGQTAKADSKAARASRLDLSPDDGAKEERAAKATSRSAGLDLDEEE